jgi:hypothetical protein
MLENFYTLMWLFHQDFIEREKKWEEREREREREKWTEENHKTNSHFQSGGDLNKNYCIWISWKQW